MHELFICEKAVGDGRENSQTTAKKCEAMFLIFSMTHAEIAKIVFIIWKMRSRGANFKFQYF